MKKIILNYLSLIHYRKSLFEMLCNSKELEYKIICGKDSPYSNMRNFVPKDTNKVVYVKNTYINFGANKLIWQNKILTLTLMENPDVIILLGFNPLILSSIVSFLVFKLFRKKVIWWGHGTLGQQGYLGVLFRLFFYKMSDGVFVYDQKGKDRLVAKGISENKIVVLNNCLNIEDYGYNIYGKKIIEREITKSNESFKIIFSGRITSRKKLDILLEAIRIILNTGIKIECNIIGDGPELKNLRALAKKLNLKDSVFFKGNLYGKDVSKYLFNSDLNIVPDAVGLSIIHGLSYGLPLITCRVSDSHGPEVSVLEPNINGDFYNSNDPSSLAEVIIKWRSKLLLEGNSVRKICVNSISETYTPEYLKNKIIDFVNNV